MNRVFIIAEAGVNHNGRLDLALKLCDKALEVGADAVKFQTFKTELIAIKNLEMAPYQKEAVKDSSSQYEMIKKLELSYDDFLKIKNYCQEIGIEFLSTPDEEQSLDFLISLGLKKIKIGSGEIDNVPFLRKIAKVNIPTIFSTGMSSLEEIKKMFSVLVAAGMDPKNITLLHCNTEYPTPLEDVNLKAMLTLKNEFGVDVGYSDHTLGSIVAIAATALGAKCIEKHFTLDNNMDGPDHKASMNPEDFKSLVTAIRNTETLLGNGEKRMTSSESKNKKLVRKMIVAKTPIKKGEKLTEDFLCLKRASKGISGFEWDKIVGQISNKDYEIDEVISEELLK